MWNVEVVIFYVRKGFVEKMISIWPEASGEVIYFGVSNTLYMSLLPNWESSEFKKSNQHTRIICKM